MKFDRVILSSDTNPKFLEFWPLVAHGWRTLFDVEVWLILVAPKNKIDLAELCKHGFVERYEPVPNVPISNQAKIARYHAAETWNDNSVIMTNDIDLLPLQSAYVNAFIRPPCHLLTVGSELYTGPEAGKFTAGYLTAESSVWRKLVNPLNFGWSMFVKSFIGQRTIDHKEDIARAVHHEDPDTFSDESLLRALLKHNPVPVIHAPRGYNPYTARALCRSNWQFDPAKLADGTYVEAHLPRPWSQHRDKIKHLQDHLKNA